MARQSFERAGVSSVVEQIHGHAPEIIYERFAGGLGAGGGEVVVGGGIVIGGGDGGGGTPWPRPGELLFDLAFFDATKMEYASYLEAVLPLMRQGGLVVADNVLSHGEEVGPFIEAVRLHPGMQSFLLEMDNGLLFAFIQRELHAAKQTQL